MKRLKVVAYNLLTYTFMANNPSKMIEKELKILLKSVTLGALNFFSFKCKGNFLILRIKNLQYISEIFIISREFIQKMKLS